MRLAGDTMPSGFRTLIGFALLFLAGFPAAATDRSAVPMADAVMPDKRVALVLGNAAYRHAPTLLNPENDARDMSVLLRGIGFDVDWLRWRRHRGAVLVLTAGRARKRYGQ